jgi:hypothetical protein
MLLSPGPQIPPLFYPPQSFKISFVPGWWIIKIQIRLLATTVRTLFVCLRRLQPDSPVGLCNSGAREALARRRWYIYVCFPALLRLSPGLYVSRPSPFASRWEFVTTLDYEWDVFRGRRPYRRTIWVCSLFLRFRHHPPTIKY